MGFAASQPAAPATLTLRLVMFAGTSQVNSGPTVSQCHGARGAARSGRDIRACRHGGRQKQGSGGGGENATRENSDHASDTRPALAQ